MEQGGRGKTVQILQQRDTQRSICPTNVCEESLEWGKIEGEVARLGTEAKGKKYLTTVVVTTFPNRQTFKMSHH